MLFEKTKKYSQSKRYEIKFRDLATITEIETVQNIIGLWIWSIKENKQIIISIDEINLHILNTEISYIKEL